MGAMGWAPMGQGGKNPRDGGDHPWDKGVGTHGTRGWATIRSGGEDPQGRGMTTHGATG